MARSDDPMTTLDWVLCILCSNIGCIVGIVYLVQGKSKGGLMIGISIAVNVIFGVIAYSTGALNTQPAIR